MNRVPAFHEIKSVTITTAGDESVGVFPHEAIVTFPGSYLTENHDGGTEGLRQDLEDAFTEIFGDPAIVVFDFEEPCPRCGGPHGCQCKDEA